MLAVDADHLVKRLPGEKRRVGADDEHVAVEPLECGRGALERVAGPPLILLHGEFHRRQAAERVLDLLPLVSHHAYDPVGPHLLHGEEHVADHLPPGEGMQDLDEGGLHPRPLPGRQDHGRERRRPLSAHGAPAPRCR